MIRNEQISPKVKILNRQMPKFDLWPDERKIHENKKVRNIHGSERTENGMSVKQNMIKVAVKWANGHHPFGYFLELAKANMILGQKLLSFSKGSKLVSFEQFLIFQFLVFGLRQPSEKYFMLSSDG